ncbi:MAG: glycosyltransferase family 2 protein [Victivallales bacterium]|nr:glycosyltransferase family 2 protein [Victivallales bacterium]
MISANILIRAHNDEAIIGRTLQAVFAQKNDFPFEVIFCDDAATDRTREIAARFPVRFLERPGAPYKPGRTLNALVQAANADLLVFNNSDAVPLDSSWLANLVSPLLEKPQQPRFAFANQMPRQDATALVRKDSERAFGDGKIQATWRFFFSIASAATWRKTLVEVPFDEQIPYSEDVEWAWRNSRRPEAPVEIVYCPNALVEHSHNYPLPALAKRYRGEGLADRIIFGDAPNLVRELAGAARETLRDWNYLIRRPADWAEFPMAPVRRFVQRFSHWRGMRDADKRRNPI